jgi:hypothetical protein
MYERERVIIMLRSIDATWKKGYGTHFDINIESTVPWPRPDKQ